MQFGPILRAMARNKTKVALLVLEIAFTTAIVLNCLAMIGAQRGQMLRDSGLDEEHLVAVQLQPWGEAFADDAFANAQAERDMAALRALPEEADASVIGPLPLQGGGSSATFKQVGGKDSDKVRAPVYNADEHVLATLGLELVEGRALLATDRPEKGGPQILNCLVTRDFADAVYPGVSPIGKLIDSGNPEFPDVIVGVVRRMVTPYGGGPMEGRIVIYPRSPSSGLQSYLVRSRGDDLPALLRQVETTLLGQQAERILTLQTMREVKGNGYALNVFLVRVLALITVLLLAVTALGIFGTTSFSVTQRTKQIGTRRALGASRTEIVRYFLLENTLIAGMGIGLGLVAAFGLNLLLVTQSAGARIGPGLVLGGVLLLWLIGVAATIVPARRASMLSPALATRTV